VGTFSFAVAVRAIRGTVLAVEPDPFLVSLLRRSSKLAENSDLKIAVLSAAISDRDGITKLAVAKRGRSSNSIAEALAGTEQGGVREELLVPTLRLDTILNHFASPNLVKIDVEGAEKLVLSGAKRILEKVRPILIIEVAADNEPSVREILLDNRYMLFDAEDLNSDALPINKCAWNTLARPREMLGSEGNLQR
jgi:FkbM family methyltransferase